MIILCHENVCLRVNMHVLSFFAMRQSKLEQVLHTSHLVLTSTPSLGNLNQRQEQLVVTLCWLEIVCTGLGSKSAKLTMFLTHPNIKQVIQHKIEQTSWYYLLVRQQQGQLDVSPQPVIPQSSWQITKADLRSPVVSCLFLASSVMLSIEAAEHASVASSHLVLFLVLILARHLKSSPSLRSTASVITMWTPTLWAVS